MNKNEVFNYLGLFFVFSIIFVSGFYFGYKSSNAKNDKIVASTSEIEALANEVRNESADNYNTLDVEGVFWIRVGQQPTCPPTHPIVGKFDKNINIYYLQDHQSYDSVKAHICFVDEEMARDTAGFVRKY
ncbi:hypothetical protein HC766_00295 [Candidatus Gracilibacteria bacterium]|nr:hypothetical protein [Candidatus Gracilibacteria bacterium]NJS40832.1 hypothetical protein [Candidatus Gracilibacteria bacterium]